MNIRSWENIKASAPTSGKISCVSCHDPSLKNNERALGVQLQDKTRHSCLHKSVVLW